MTVLADFLNRLRTCLKRRTIIAGPGVTLKETEDGVVVSASIPTGPIIWVHVCFNDNTEAYLPVRVAGNPHRTVGAADYDAVTVVEEDIPDGSILLE